MTAPRGSAWEAPYTAGSSAWIVATPPDLVSTFCTECEIHQATSTRPVCPVCLDEDRRAKEAS